VQAVIEAGAVGINLEDSLPNHALRDCTDAAERIHAARSATTMAGVPIVINARVDCWMLPATDEDERFKDAVHRAKAYLAAGADCVYPIGLGDIATLAAFVKALDAPANVGARPGVPGLAELAQLGVARVSTATRFATIALGAVDNAAQAMCDSGGFDSLGPSLTHPDVQRLFAPG